MSSEALTKTLGVLSNLTEKIQYFNTSQKEAKELITVRNCQDFFYPGLYSEAFGFGCAPVILQCSSTIMLPNFTQGSRNRHPTADQLQKEL